MSLPTVSWDETTPANTDLFSEGDDRIQELKTQIRELFAYDHIWESSGQGSTWGRHDMITLQVQSSDPSSVLNTIILYSKDSSNSKAELNLIDEDDNIMQLTKSGDFLGGMSDERRMYSGLVADIPEGWEVDSFWDASSNAYFLRGVNDGSTNPGTIGGSNTFYLYSSNFLPSHGHTITVNSDGSHYHTAVAYSYYGVSTILSATLSGGSEYGITSYSTTQSDVISLPLNSATHTHSSTSSLEGSGASSGFDNQPAYYELCFLKRSA